MSDFKGKRAIITGGAGGIGREIARAFRRAGAEVALVDIDRKGLREAGEELGCFTIEADLADPDAIEKGVDALTALHPTWDILVNNAAVVKRGPLLDFSWEDWDHVQQVNLRSVFLFSRGIVRGMIEEGRGKIINMSSNATFYGTPGSGPYSVSKAGVNQLTKTMAIEWGAHNIQVNAICPTITMTELGKKIWDDPALAEMRAKLVGKIPLGRFLEPEEIAPLVLFLASPDADFVNGAIIPIDGGGQYNPA